MADVLDLHSIEQWETLWQAQQAGDAAPLMIFKKSPICPTSHMAEAQWEQWTRGLPADLTAQLARVDVVNDRPVSQRIAADTGVTHQSPQALLIGTDGAVRWHASHGGIDEASLGAALKS